MVAHALSLKARAIALLAQREHSVLELRRKLMRIARAAHAKSVAAPDALNADLETDVEAQAIATEVDTLLPWLQAQGYLSEQRFVESRIRVRSERFGTARIKQELAQQGARLDVDQLAQLRDSEGRRAAQVRERKFGPDLPLDPADRARQTRFLAGRGFSSGAIRNALRGAST